MGVERSLITASRNRFSILLFTVLLAACIPNATRATSSDVPAQTQRITVNSVRVDSGQGIYITGQSSLPKGACVQTELLADQKPQAWWPKDACIEPDDTGSWELLVGLGRNGAPQSLAAGVQYEIRAWWSKNETATSTRFPFDLDGPPSP